MLNNSITCSIAVTYKILHPFNFYGMYKTIYINHFQSPLRVPFYDHISFNSCLTILHKIKQYSIELFYPFAGGVW